MKRIAMLIMGLAAATAFAADPGKNLTNSGVVVGQSTGAMVMNAMDCPTPYNKYTNGVNTKKGEYYCVKADVGCPDGFTGSMDNATGKLTCTPKPVPCPVGWTGGMVEGKLICTSIPQPKIPCPAPDKTAGDDGNKWGTTYYTVSWNKMGCVANNKPAF